MQHAACSVQRAAYPHMPCPSLIRGRSGLRIPPDSHRLHGSTPPSIGKRTESASGVRGLPIVAIFPKMPESGRGSFVNADNARFYFLAVLAKCIVNSAAESMCFSPSIGPKPYCGPGWPDLGRFRRSNSTGTATSSCKRCGIFPHDTPLHRCVASLNLFFFLGFSPGWRIERYVLYPTR